MFNCLLLHYIFYQHGSVSFGRPAQASVSEAAGRGGAEKLHQCWADAT